MIKEFDLVSGKYNFLNIKGLVHSAFKNNLYFLRTPDENIIYSNVNLYRYNMEDEISYEVISNISGEKTYLYPSEDKLVCEIIIDGEFKSIVWDIRDKKSRILNIEKDKEGSLSLIHI